MIKNLKTIFLFLCLILIFFNTCQLIQTLAPNRPIAFSGMKFAGLNDVLKNETQIGYVTDLDANDSQNLAEFEQAQYMLAPAILEWNNTATRLLIVNCSSDATAIEKLIKLGAQPLKRNQFGIILAQNPRGLLKP
jgi:hypothetical protein